uniref:Cytochrome c oxidase subunit 3 n=1 Tax=Allobathynella sp. JHS-2017 TaxID=2025385 RepID=A0A7R6D7E0_9CRUS|nr:cytochrome oxidase subunit 3 [Allobathynella sp. JHS-2017]
MTNNHPYHLVDISPWPIINAMNTMMLLMGLVMWFHEKTSVLLVLVMMSLLLTCTQWWRNISQESTFQGIHTKKVMSNLRWGMIFFILSEVLFFMSFFWAFFHSSLAPMMELGGVWPPTMIIPFDYQEVPLINTIILLSSGATVTWSHYSLLENDLKQSTMSLLMTISLGFIFTLFQGMEYYEAPFCLSDSAYGSTFFIATGFHGLHVIIGTSLLTMMYLRLNLLYLSKEHHVGFEMAAWYWHFVDVVWLFLYTFIYWWGS